MAVKRVKKVPIFWHVIHTHKHGVDVYLVQSRSWPNLERVKKLLDIDYDPERDYLDIDMAGGILVLSGKGRTQRALEKLHDIFSNMVEDGRVKWSSAAERERALKVFAESSAALSAELGSEK